MKNNDKITSYHLQRNAYIYIRQSTEHQVRDNLESQQRQYELAQVAREYGWPQEAIIVIDEDLGRSGKSSTGRTGFARLVAEVALYKAGIIFGLEVSRLARNNKDWYHLLDLCSLTQTLIGDADGIYNPTLFNDRLLLGLKGTMSEAELHMLKSRMLQGLYHKAQKGELRFALPAGYEFDPEGNIIKSLNEEVRHCLELTFKRFFELGTINGVLRGFLEEGLLFPRRAPWDKEIRWVRPYHKAIQNTLTNPLYAGAYVFGRTKIIKILDDDGNPRSRQQKQTMDNWDVIIHDHHPAYITWEQYLKILKQMELSTSPPKFEASQVAREGSALLQGLARCGICGRSMHTSYHGKFHHVYPYYLCNMSYRQYGKSYCQNIGGRRVDQTVAQLFLEAMSPASLDIHLKALSQIQNQQDLTLNQMKLQWERAQYEAERAFRQYNAVEPENRLVARTLERQWNDRLKEVEELKARINIYEKEHQDKLQQLEKEQIIRLAQELPALWQAPTTSDRDKKRLLRAAMQEVQLTKKDRDVTIKVLWAGGAVTDKTIQLPKAKNPRHTDQDTVELIRQLAKKFNDAQISRILIRKGIKTATGLPFNSHKVGNLRGNHNIPRYKKPKGEDPKAYTAEQAAEILGVCIHTVRRWVQDGFIKGEQMLAGAPWEIYLTDEDITRLTAKEVPSGWLPLEKAAQALGVSKQTILHWVKSKKLNYVYVSKGKRKGLRIDVNSSTYRNQLTLFPPEFHKEG